MNGLFNNMLFCWSLGLFGILSGLLFINIFAKEKLNQFFVYLGGYFGITIPLTAIHLLFFDIHWVLYIYVFYASVVFGMSTAMVDISMRNKYGK